MTTETIDTETTTGEPTHPRRANSAAPAAAEPRQAAHGWTVPASALALDRR